MRFAAPTLKMPPKIDKQLDAELASNPVRFVAKIQAGGLSAHLEICNAIKRLTDVGLTKSGFSPKETAVLRGLCDAHAIEVISALLVENKQIEHPAAHPSVRIFPV